MLLFSLGNAVCCKLGNRMEVDKNGKNKKKNHQKEERKKVDKTKETQEDCSCDP